MTRSNFIKMSGWFMAASSLFFVFSWLAGSRPEYNPYNALSLPIDGLLNVATGPLFLLGMLSISVGILGLKTFFGAQAGGLGKAGLNTSLIGTAVSIVGIIGMVISDGGPWWETTMIGVTALFIGLFLFGIRCINRKPFSRWNSLPLLTGILWPVFILSDLLVIQKTNLGFELSQAVIAGIIFTSFTGVALIGYQLQTEIQKTPPEPA